MLERSLKADLVSRRPCSGRMKLETTKGALWPCGPSYPTRNKLGCWTPPTKFLTQCGEFTPQACLKQSVLWWIMKHLDTSSELQISKDRLRQSTTPIRFRL